ncbi:hypothetical protein CWS43_09630 [Rahnella sp. AA]|uniref:hypothetical protein n=1 Tax=Rahnella sp. AA TaxID=2057180 RepID=UPI000C3228F6|nr:hypothetical protein [Rahnella sp. AA]PKE30933.1 hypothetical protein CWS43_09630 [Rahnella sp. AA]
MDQDLFEQAPLPLLTRFQVGDRVKLLTFPVGVHPASYQLDVAITSIHDGEFEGEIVRIAPLGRLGHHEAHFTLGGHVAFFARNIQGMAA